MKTILKTAAAFFAFAAVTGAAQAEDFALAQSIHTIDNSAVLQNVYAAMEKNRIDTFQFVMASAQARMEDRLTAMEFKIAPMPSFTIVSN